MVKPKGSTGATKMKIMAIICYNQDCKVDSYGYNIWQTLKDPFITYLNDCDVRNVYKHLKELQEMGFLDRIEKEAVEEGNRCLYSLTEKGHDLSNKFEPYLKFLQRITVS
jgi:DNA-binding PadR family transcriptional regulator